MSDGALPAIEASGIGKRYRIGRRIDTQAGLRETLSAAGAALARRIAGRRDGDGGGDAASEIWALRDVSFSMKRGEALGVIGRNGAGKSTLFKVLARITDPTEGRARVRGRVASLLEVGTGFQGDLTGRENVYLNGAILGMKRAEIAARFDEIVAFAEVEKFIDTPVKRYSSGMYMRLAFAVAAHLEPEILIVDEVLAVGDAAFQAKCLARMRSLPESGRTVLFVSHNMAAIRQLCERSLLLEQGRVVFDGPTEETIDRYQRSLPRPKARGDLARRIADLPPDPVFTLLDFSVRQDGHDSDAPSVGRPVQVVVRYALKQDVVGFTLGVDVCDQDGLIVVESFHNGAGGRVPKEHAGTYESVLEIPAEFLAPIPYEIRLRPAIFGHRELLTVPIGVFVTMQGGGRVNSALPGYKTMARITPLLPWTTTEAAESPAPKPEDV